MRFNSIKTLTSLLVPLLGLILSTTNALSKELDGFVQTSSLPQQNSSSSSVVVGNNLYLIGGGDATSYSRSILKAVINSDGTLGAWETAGQLPVSRFWHKAIEKGGYIYVLGGAYQVGNISQVSTTDSVISSKIKPDGTISNNWSVLNSIPDKIGRFSHIVSGNNLYLFGGIKTTHPSTNEFVSENVYKTEILEDGTIGNWTIVNSLPKKIAESTTFEINDKIYLVGGMDEQKKALKTTYQGIIMSNGHIQWSQISDLPIPLRRASSMNTDGKSALVMGGYTGTDFSDKIYSIGNDLIWKEKSTKLPTKMCCFEGFKTDNDWVVITGGHNGAYFNSTYISSLSLRLLIEELKQTSQPWGTDTYDAASTWAGTYGTIARWGCAITSTSMLLSHYGYNFSPRDINFYLKDHNGYLRNGAVIWNNISRMVKENSDGTKPLLEYNRVAFDKELVKSRIDNNTPSIIKLTNPVDQSTHFVLARGYSPTNIFINDPGDNKTKLSEYPIEFPSRADFFTPSNTDLSYIYLAYPIGTEISLYSPSGQLIQGSRFLEYPPYDNETKLPNPNPALNLLTVAKPAEGRYKIVVNSDKHYFIDSYLFNKNGVSVDGTQNSFENRSRTDVFYFNIGNENSSPEKLTFDYVKSRLNYWNNQKAISTALLKNISLQLDLAERRHKTGDKKTVKPTLNAIVKLINKSTPKLISIPASKDLVEIITKLSEVI